MKDSAGTEPSTFEAAMKPKMPSIAAKGASEAEVDSVFNLTGFALVGGPASQDHDKAVEVLESLNRPYLCAVPLVFQSFEEWQKSELGLHPIQVALQVSLPEIDGAIEPSGPNRQTNQQNEQQRQTPTREPLDAIPHPSRHDNSCQNKTQQLTDQRRTPFTETGKKGFGSINI